MRKNRIQLTLFFDEHTSAMIEKIRKEFNPAQYELIKSHVTLCREDELDPVEKVIRNLQMLNHDFISIDFGPIIKFAADKGVLIPAKGKNEGFHQLRKLILTGAITNLRNHEPHITLMHPRNSTCTESIFQQIAKIKLPDKIEFSTISLIEQQGESKWKILEEFALNRCLACEKEI